MDDNQEFDSVEEETLTETPEDSEESHLEPPEHWSQDHRELFVNQPREVQEFLLDRHKAMEGDYTRKSQELAKYKKLGETLEESFSPYRQDFEMNGLDETGAVKQLLAVHDLLKRNPEEGLTWLAQQYNYQPSTDYEQDSGYDEYADPETLALRRELNEIKTGLNQFQQAQQQQAQKEVINRFNSFQSQTDSTGNLAHPLYDDVKHTMAKLYQQGFTDLDQAYKMSVAASPDLQAKEREIQAEYERKQKLKTVSNAKKAAQGVKSTSGNTKQSEVLTTREVLERYWSEHS